MQEYTGQVSGWPTKSSPICVKCVFNNKWGTTLTVNSGAKGLKLDIRLVWFFFGFFCLFYFVLFIRFHFKVIFLTIYRPYTPEPKESHREQFGGSVSCSSILRRAVSGAEEWNLRPFNHWTTSCTSLDTVIASLAYIKEERLHHNQWKRRDVVPESVSVSVWWTVCDSRQKRSSIS